MFTTKGFCLVTGASKGIGKSIAIQLATEWHEGGAELDLMLLARDEAGLKHTEVEITSKAPSVRVVKVSCDLSDVSKLDEVMSKMPAGQYDSFLLVHNAGTCPDTNRPLLGNEDGPGIQKHFAINFTSMVVLNSLLLTKLESVKVKTVVYLSSPLSSFPMHGFGFYGALKAARDSYAKVLALENPSVRVLCYCPGPCDTEMYRTLRDVNYSEDVRKNITRSYENGQVLQPDTTTVKLVSILKANSFDSGQTIDYYDGVLKGVVDS
ncbi:sepiapterin reductase-like [Dysidea avara]|uniref:sepiapterin reductase-like n=1 Tax=Dysidea avara TaxID=196820 RepID=UPI0033221417